jgi:hypothetical protein
MAQLKVKQIKDFVSGVKSEINGLVGTTTVTAIADAKSEAIVAAVSADVVVLSSAVAEAEAKDVLRASTAVVNIATAKSEAIVAAVSADVVVLSSAKAHSDLQKVRIDALLLNSTDALNTFAEIETFITGLSTADVTAVAALSTAVYNDSVHSTAIAANTTAIADLETSTVDLSLDANRTQNIVDNTNGDGVTLSGATFELAGLMTADDFTKLSAIEEGADVTDSDNVRTAGALMEGDITNLDQVKAFASSDYASAAQGLLAASALQNASAFDASGSAATAKSEAIVSANTYTDTEIAALDGRIDGLEGASSDEVVATFVGTTSFRVDNAFDLTGHVAVFVNGLQVHESFGAEGAAEDTFEGWRSADGLAFTVQNLGYLLEDNDHIIVSGTLA